MGDVIDIQESIRKLISEVANNESGPNLAEAKVLTDALSVFRDFRSIRDDGLRAAVEQIVALVASISADRDLASAQISKEAKSKSPAKRARSKPA